MIAVFMVIAALVPGDVTEFRLSNGIPVVTRTLPGDVEGLSLFLIGGTRVQDPDNQGLEAMALEAAMDGGGDFPGERWREVMDRTRASLTGSYNYDFSRIHLRCLSEDLALLIHGLRECLAFPELSDHTVERVRSRTLSQLSIDLAHPDRMVWRVSNQGFMPENHPYLLRPDGTIETVSEATGTDLRGLLEERIHAGNLLITHAGPTEPGALKEILENSFGIFPPGTPADLRVEPPGALRDTLVVEELEAATTYIVVKFRAPPPGHGDQPAFEAAMMVADHLLWQILRTDHALTYAAGAGVTTDYSGNWGYMYATTSSPRAACSLMTLALASIAEGDVDPEILPGAVRTRITIEGVRAETMDAQCRLLGSGTLAAGHWRTFFNPGERYGDLTLHHLSASLRKWVDTGAWGIVTRDRNGLDMTSPFPLGIHPMDEQGLIVLEGGVQVLYPGSRSETVIITDAATGYPYALVGDRARRLIAEGAAVASVKGRLTREGWSVREDLPRVLVTEVETRRL